MRDQNDEMQVLLLKRHRASGFVPGAYVFPGGRTDDADATPELREHCRIPERGSVPAHYWFGAVREVFEETGVLLARDGRGVYAPDASSSAELEAWREKLMSNQATLLAVVRALNLQVALDNVVYFAHWITPEAEPRRYDTRFFAAALPEGRTIRPDAREMDDALWISPADALERFEAGALPMVFPTVRTLQQLAPFRTVHDALEDLKTKDVDPVLPRLVRTDTGVGIVIDEEGEV
jgi:8-oxo-dGTP pyrophosphatase MutT (NUDIX family)